VRTGTGPFNESISWAAKRVRVERPLLAMRLREDRSTVDSAIAAHDVALSKVARVANHALRLGLPVRASRSRCHV